MSKENVLKFNTGSIEEEGGNERQGTELLKIYLEGSRSQCK